MRRIGLVTIALALYGAANAQPDRARGVLQEGLAALGGADRITQSSKWVAEAKGRENTSAEMQGYRFGQPTWRPHEERIAIDLPSLTTVWERHTPRNDGTLRWRRFISAAQSSGFVDWTVRRASSSTNGVAESARRALARRVPHLLLLETDRDARLRWLGERRSGSRTADLLEARFPDGALVTLVLDGRPVRLGSIEYRAYLPGVGDVLVSWTWHGWRDHPTLGHVPRGHTVHIDGVPFQEVEYTAYGPSDAAAVSLLELPKELIDAAQPRVDASETQAAPAAPLPVSGEVVPGVHLFRFSGFVVMAIEVDDYLVAIEAPESHPGFELVPPTRAADSVTAAFLDQLRGMFPSKPVRYAVITHHHSDHMGGMLRLANLRATILVAPSDRSAVDALLSRAHTLAPGPVVSRDKINVHAIADRHVIGSGSRAVHIYNVRENPHTAENLVVWLPGPRILFQGDLFYYSEGGVFPPAGRHVMNRFFAEWLTARGIEPIAVYGVHNRGAASAEHLEMSLNRR